MANVRSTKTMDRDDPSCAMEHLMTLNNVIGRLLFILSI